MNGYMFLDVDGVINPYKSLSAPGRDWKVVRIDGFAVWTSKHFGRWLTSLVDRGVTIVWASTWVAHDQIRGELCEHFGIACDWPKIDRLERNPEDAELNDCGKRPGIIRFLAEHNIDPQVIPCVWIDDQLGAGDRRWGIANNFCMFRPRPTHGIAEVAVRNMIEDEFGLNERVPSSA